MLGGVSAKGWKGKKAMIGLPDNSISKEMEFLGLWGGDWYARARLAWQAERYHIWLRKQGCSRDQAAEMAVRLLMAQAPDAPEAPASTSASLIH